MSAINNFENSSYRRATPPPSLPGFEHINKYWDKVHDMYAAKILPGQFYITKQDEAVITVLGSCISACIRDPEIGIGGMNHFMLPRANRDKGGNGNSDAARYGNYAMEMLINEILKNGGQRERLEVKIFGGGRIINSMTDIGKRNIEFTRHYIETEGLNLLSSDLGETCPRKVYYFPLTGNVKLKRLRSLHNTTVLEREEIYMTDINTTPVSGDVDLF